MVRVTIRDVARAAGVSQATISLVLNDAPGVSTATRERVRGIMKELQYRPDALARSFSSRKAKAVALVLPALRDSLGDPYYTLLLAGVLEAVRDRGFKLILEVADDRFTEQKLWRDLYEGKRVDGLLIATPKMDQDYLREVSERKCPTLLLNGERPDLPQLDYVGFDDYRCGMDAARYLIGLGHRRIAHIAGPANQASALRRREGFKDALAAAHLPLPGRSLTEGDYTIESGRAAMRRILIRPGRERPTALFCANDAMAIGAMLEAHAHGIRIPDALSVIGVDDSGAAERADPPLTTLRQDVFLLGFEAAERFIHKLESREDSSSHIELRKPMALVERESCQAQGGKR